MLALTMLVLFGARMGAADPLFSVSPGLLYVSPDHFDVSRYFEGGLTAIQPSYPVTIATPPARNGLPHAAAKSAAASLYSGCGSSSVGGAGKASGIVGASRYLQTTADPDCDEFWGPDKWRHVGVWFGGTLGLYLFFKTVFKTSKWAAYLISAFVMSAIGLAREISDSNSEKNCFSEQDLFANTVGILSAGLVIAIF